MKKKTLPLPLPEVVTQQDLADMAGITERWVRELADKGVIPKLDEPGRYPFKAAISGLIAHFREQANGMPAQKSADQARQAKADADRAEMAAAKDAGTLMLTADAKRMWSDGFVKIRDVVLRSNLTAKQKQEIADKMQKITINE